MAVYPGPFGITRVRTGPSLIRRSWGSCAPWGGRRPGRWRPRRTPRPAGSRSEERRVGKECRSPWSPYHLKKNTLHLLQSPTLLQLRVYLSWVRVMLLGLLGDAIVEVFLRRREAFLFVVFFFKQKTAYEIDM